MQKLPLRPLRLIRLMASHSGDSAHANGSSGGQQSDQASDEVDAPMSAPIHTDQYAAAMYTTEKHSIMPIDTGAKALTPEETTARQLLKRTPNSYLFNQAYGLWLYLSLFLLTLIVTRNAGTSQYGVFAAVQTAMNTIMYIVALGLEDAIATLMPRIFAEYGQASAAHFIRRLLILRLSVVLFSAVLIAYGLPTLALLIGTIPIKGSAGVAAALTDPVLLAHTAPIAVYVIGTGIANLFNTVYAALMRMERVLVIGSLAQLALLPLAYLALRAEWGIDGVLWAQAAVAVIAAVAYSCWLAPFLLTFGPGYRQPLRPVLRLGFSAWQTNLVSGALLKQVAIILLAAFTAKMADTAIGYFNLSFQLADAANVLLVAGFAGVGGSALAAAFIGNDYDRLGRTWQALIKVETLLAAPGLIFCLFNAQNLVHALYKPEYAPVGSLMAIFLFCNILVRVLGTTIHQSSLYVTGQARLVVFSQWIGMALVIVLGVVLIPVWGPAGALVADGVARIVTGVLLLIFLLRKLPREHPLGLLSFTWRFLCALVLAALPGILWHPADRVLLGLSGVLFLLLCVAFLYVIKPLSREDSKMLSELNPRLARYLRWFARI